HRITGVDHAERLITLLDRIDDDAERHDVGELLERDVLALHLQPDRARTLLAAGDRGLELRLLEVPRQLGDDPRDEIAAAPAQELQALDDRFAGVRIELRESEILELVLPVLDADALC